MMWCFSPFLFEPHSEDNVLLPFQKSLCNVVFSALAESNASLQVTATKVLATLGQQSGECILEAYCATAQWLNHFNIVMKLIYTVIEVY